MVGKKKNLYQDTTRAREKIWLPSVHIEINARFFKNFQNSCTKYIETKSSSLFSYELRCSWQVLLLCLCCL